mmetsp:Transcript_97299/g.275308  ORF Transcript_97299/g.275308 Transcript_97299/m.275308 type:complete len:368 (-) Transcript_97299:123-1226(-)
MATDSKLIHSQRKAQYIQLPAHMEVQQTFSAPQMPPGPAGSPHGWPSTPSPLPRAEVRTPRGGTPRRTPAASARPRTPDFCMTPQVGATSSTHSPYCQPPADAEQLRLRQDLLREPLTADEVERLCGYDLRSPVAVRSLALQNTKLRRKLSRSRARSQERVVRAERERDALGAENSALQRECESLRTLFIRQQQQQIAFWTGPFMEMIAPKEGSASLAASIRGAFGEHGAAPPAAAGSAGSTATASASPVASPGTSLDAGTRLPPEASSSDGHGPDLAQAAAPKEPEDARSDSIRSLQRERDYWRLLATDLKRSARGGRNSQKGSQQPGSDLSTSQSQREGSEPSRAPWSGSESGSELSARSFAAET